MWFNLHSDLAYMELTNIFLIFQKFCNLCDGHCVLEFNYPWLWEVHRLAVFIGHVFLQKYVKKQKINIDFGRFIIRVICFWWSPFFVSCWDAEPFVIFIFCWFVLQEHKGNLKKKKISYTWTLDLISLLDFSSLKTFCQMAAETEWT